MLASSLRHALFAMWIPVCVIVALGLFTVITALRISMPKALQILKPFWWIALINLVVMALGTAIKVAPFYLHQRVWSPHTTRLISLVQDIPLLVMLIWIIVSFRKWNELARQIDTELKQDSKLRS